MATKLCLSLLLICFCSLLSSSIASESQIDYWCSKTPNPEPCKYFMKRNPKHFLPKQKSDFRKMAIELAMQRALHAQNHNKWLGPKCRNGKEKAAWADCLRLYQDTIAELNRTIVSKTKCTEFDSQTWLSTALTNLETCKAGFRDFGVSDFVLPLMSNNVSKLIRNTLALKDNASSTLPQTYEDSFPGWLKTGDRKLLQTSSPTPNLVVAQDGSGNYRTIKAALDAAAKRSGSRRFVIRIKSGVYRENLDIGKNLKNIMLVGDGLRFTIITGSRSVGGGFTTFNSATVAVTGEGFIARGITFRNTAGPQKPPSCGPPIRLRPLSLLPLWLRRLPRHLNCMIYARRPMAQQKNVVTAQGRSDPNQNTGISIHNSRVMASSDLRPVLRSFKTFLGRPWKEYSRTVFLQTYLDSLVDPAGWLEWDGNFALNTLYYGEYRNFGPAASTGGRVKWRGYRVITSSTEASRFTVANFIAGRSWLPATGVPFYSGL
ncbi:PECTINESTERASE [Salix viminalis]|uniref:Pectinesterase n=2 Tax=Salix TaxID=40685 RepID=A0A9Q0NUP9_SALVM|nr:PECTINESTERASE [Salix viminalis]